MKFTDLIALAKNGYSPKDIKDLLAMADPEPEPEPAPADPEPEPEPAPADPQEDPKDPAEPGPEEDKKDYKKAYEDLLKKYQEENRHQNTEKPAVPAEEKLADIFRGMM